VGLRDRSFSVDVLKSSTKLAAKMKCKNVDLKKWTWSNLGGRPTGPTPSLATDL